MYPTPPGCPDSTSHLTLITRTDHDKRLIFGRKARNAAQGSARCRGTLFVLGWLCPLFVPVVAASNLPHGVEGGRLGAPC